MKAALALNEWYILQSASHLHSKAVNNSPRVFVLSESALDMAWDKCSRNSYAKYTFVGCYAKPQNYPRVDILSVREATAADAGSVTFGVLSLIKVTGWRQTRGHVYLCCTRG